MRSVELTGLVDGLRFGEGPRWAHGRLWFSDIVANRVMTATETGETAVVAEISSPSGLGFLPDGSLLVAGMASRKLLRVDEGEISEWADLSGLGDMLNDMVVTASGAAYVDVYRRRDRFSADPGPDGSPRMMSHDIDRYYVNGLGIAPDLIGGIALVMPGQPPRMVVDDLEYPNGLVVTPDGGTLLASLSNAGRLVAFDIDADGGLSNMRSWAELPGRHPDGICLDAEGAVWVACVATSAFIRVVEGGEITHHVPTPGRWAVAPMLGGADRRTLFAVSMEPISVPDHRSSIAVGRVDVAGAGFP